MRGWELLCTSKRQGLQETMCSRIHNQPCRSSPLFSSFFEKSWLFDLLKNTHGPLLPICKPESQCFYFEEKHGSDSSSLQHSRASVESSMDKKSIGSYWGLNMSSSRACNFGLEKLKNFPAKVWKQSQIFWEFHGFLEKLSAISYTENYRNLQQSYQTIQLIYLTRKFELEDSMSTPVRRSVHRNGTYPTLKTFLCSLTIGVSRA